ncbi:MAG: hypothetical protein PHX45_04680 [Acidobacteriota bacterium]|nr:hypothetical protein [Acidobacteriota bacterium]
MKKAAIASVVLCLLLVASAYPATTPQGQAEKGKTAARQENPANLAAASMLDLLTKNMHVKRVVGDPVKVGNITVIPVIMIDVGYGGGGGGAPGQPQMGSGFYMGGEARPLGFIIVTKSGAKFVSAGMAPRS